MNPHIVALNEIKGIGIAFIKKITEKLTSPDEIFKCSKKELLGLGVRGALMEEIYSKKSLNTAEEIISKAERSGINIMTFDDETYPELLREISAAPPVIYSKGNRDALQKNFIAVVGTRSPNSYGISATQKICSGLVKEKLAIVSGLAIGIDAVSHVTAISEGGVTVAVLGSGVDNIYPRTNIKIAEKILCKGLIISEFSPGTPPVPQNFPRRNRIISGIALGTLIVQSEIKGGSMITARYALQQDREIFAVPGNIFDSRSRGPIHLIKEGAIPVRSSDDILSTFNSMPNLFKSDRSKVPKDIPTVTMSSAEEEIYSILEYSPLRIDEIEERSAKSSFEIFPLLLQLELKGIIKQNHCQMFSKV